MISFPSFELSLSVHVSFTIISHHVSKKKESKKRGDRYWSLSVEK